MGQKCNPIGLRLGIVKTWDSRWFARKEYAILLEEDITIRRYLRKRLPNSGISRVIIERASNKVDVTIHTAKPGVVIGKSGAQVNQLRDELQHLTKKDVFIDIKAVENPEADSQLVAEQIARQLEQRVGFRRVLKRAVSQAMRAGAKGVRVVASGRIGGAEMARTEGYREGRVPLHTLAGRHRLRHRHGRHDLRRGWGEGLDLPRGDPRHDGRGRQRLQSRGTPPSRLARGRSGRRQKE